MAIETLGRTKLGEPMKVGGSTAPRALAGALASVIREDGKAQMQAIGAGALNKAIKAIAIARGFLAPSGIDLICWPAFVEVEVDGKERTALRLFIEPKEPITTLRLPATSAES